MRFFSRLIVFSAFLILLSSAPSLTGQAGESILSLGKNKQETSAQKRGEASISEAKERREAPAGLEPAGHAIPVRVIISDDESVTFNVEVADTPKELAMGLMFLTEIPEYGGMLFVFPSVSEHKFWMKNTYVPLDMLFIKKDGTIHHIHHNAQPHDETHISSQGPVKYVLEIRGGTAKSLGIEAGDKVKIPKGRFE